MFEFLQVWHMWMIAGILLFVWEIFTPGFVVACFGIGAIAAGLATLMGLGIKTQLTVYALVSAGTGFFIRPLVIKMLSKGSAKTESNVDALAGKTAIVIEKVEPRTEAGYVRLAGDRWRAVSLTGETFDKGEKVVIERIEGTKVFVKPADE